MNRVYGQADFEYLRPEVWAFAIAMEDRLRKNEHKRGWKQMDVQDLLNKGLDSFGKLCQLIEPDGVVTMEAGLEQVVDETADCANFMMMVSDVYAIKYWTGKKDGK